MCLCVFMCVCIFCLKVDVQIHSNQFFCLFCTLACSHNLSFQSKLFNFPPFLFALLWFNLICWFGVIYPNKWLILAHNITHNKYIIISIDSFFPPLFPYFPLGECLNAHIWCVLSVYLRLCKLCELFAVHFPCTVFSIHT